MFFCCDSPVKPQSDVTTRPEEVQSPVAIVPVTMIAAEETKAIPPTPLVVAPVPPSERSVTVAPQMSMVAPASPSERLPSERQPSERLPEPALVAPEPPKTPAPPADPNIIQVSFDKKAGQPFGFALNRDDPRGLSINSWVDDAPENSLGNQYNKTAGDQKLKPGYIIQKVNGESGTPAVLVDRMKSTQEEVLLTIMKVPEATWEVTIQKSRLTPLGIKTKDILNSTSVEVTEITPTTGPLAKFNKENKSLAIKVGDIILACNGLTSREETDKKQNGKFRTVWLGEMIQRVHDTAKLKVMRPNA